MKIVKIASLLIVVLTGLAYLYISFQPSMRFADPSPNARLDYVRNYACYHDRIYLGTSNMDALFLGSSPTFRALDTDLAEQAYNRVHGERPDFFAFGTGWGNPALNYFYFRDYLANNPAPKVALIEVTPIARMGSKPRYVHPRTPDLAPTYIYFDVLDSWSFVRHKVFAISDFLHLLIRHIDLSLGKLLIADYKFSVPEGDNCATENASDYWDDFKVAADISFEQMLASEVDKVTPDIPSNTVGTLDGLLKEYKEDDSMLELLKKPWIQKVPLWTTHEGRERNLDYYRRIVALGAKHSVKGAFYIIPSVLRPEPAENQVRQLEEELGAPLFLLPAEYAKVSYHHYADRAHVTPDFRPAYAVWVASLFDNLVKRG
tara:strand:+ start:3818 stop:4939 length:1122 start_codon:yes stop_codon:yes gene_type:complete